MFAQYDLFAAVVMLIELLIGKYILSKGTGQPRGSSADGDMQVVIRRALFYDDKMDKLPADTQADIRDSLLKIGKLGFLDVKRLMYALDAQDPGAELEKILNEMTDALTPAPEGPEAKRLRPK